MHTCEMLGDVAALVAKAEQGRNTRVVGDTLKETVVSQQRTVRALKEQLAAQQAFSAKVLKKNKETEVALETATRRLRNELKKSYDLEVANKELRIKVLDARFQASQGQNDEDGNTSTATLEAGLHDEVLHRRSLHEHHDKLRELHDMVEHLHNALADGKSHDKMKEASEKLREELTDVYAHYMQGPYHPSHWRNPEDRHPKQHNEEHTIASEANGPHVHPASERQRQDPQRQQTGDALKDRIASLSTTAFWTWDFTHLYEAVCAAAGMDAARFVVCNYVSGGYISSDDATVDGNAGSIGCLFRIHPADAAVSLAAATVEEGSPITIPDLGADHRRHPTLDLKPWDDAVTSMISVPIKHKLQVADEERQVVIGVLQVAAKGRGGVDENAEAAVQALADECAEPLAVRLRNEAKILDFAARTTAVAEGLAATVAGSYDAALIVPLIEQHVRRTIVCDAATVLWVDRAEPPALHRVDGSSVVAQALHGLTEHCIDAGEILNISNVQEFPGFMEECDVLPGGPETPKSLLLIPILGANKRTIGALRLQSVAEGAFNSFEAHSINTIRAMASLALGSVLQNSTVSFSRRDRVLCDLREDSETRPIHRACRALASQLSAAANGKAADVLLYGVDEVQYQIEMINFSDDGAHRTRKATEMGSGICGDTAATGLVSRVANTCQDERFSFVVDLSGPETSNRPSLWMPIRNIDGQVTGVAAVFAQEDDGFDDNTCAILMRLCHEFGAYFSDLVYMDALDSERRRWKMVSGSILQVFDSPDVSATIFKIKEAFCEVLSLGRCQQWTFDAKTASLTYSPGRGAGKDVTVSVNGPEHLCKCARSGKMYILPAASIEDDAGDVREDLRGLPNSAQKALMVTPLMDSSHKPIMVLQVTSTVKFSMTNRESVY